MARPGRRNFTISPAGSGSSPFQDNAAAIYTIANTGAMLLIGQERSKLNAALAAESRCEAIVPVRPRLTLVEFQALTTAARGRHVLLTEMLEVRILPGEPTPLSFNELRTFSGNSALR